MYAPHTTTLTIRLYPTYYSTHYTSIPHMPHTLQHSLCVYTPHTALSWELYISVCTVVGLPDVRQLCLQLLPTPFMGTLKTKRFYLDYHEFLEVQFLFITITIYDLKYKIYPSNVWKKLGNASINIYTYYNINTFNQIVTLNNAWYGSVTFCYYQLICLTSSLYCWSILIYFSKVV